MAAQARNRTVSEQGLALQVQTDKIPINEPFLTTACKKLVYRNWDFSIHIYLDFSIWCLLILFCSFGVCCENEWLLLTMHVLALSWKWIWREGDMYMKGSLHIGLLMIFWVSMRCFASLLLGCRCPRASLVYWGVFSSSCLPLALLWAWTTWGVFRTARDCNAKAREIQGFFQLCRTAKHHNYFLNKHN